MATLADIEHVTGVTVLDYLARDADVPVITDAACQGDVSLRRVTNQDAATTPIPAAGVPVVRGEAGGNTHSLHGAGTYDPAQPGQEDDLLLGVLTVPSGGEAWLLHPEHGGMAIQPGTWLIGRQREFAGEWRLVAD